MNVGVILAIGIGVATALVLALFAARRAGDSIGPEANYGRELEAPAPGARRRRAIRPEARQRAMLAAIVAALAAIGAGLATALSQGPH